MGRCIRTKLFFCHPYSAYERGSNENQNLLIRRFFPKGTSFDKIAFKYIQQVENWINNYRARFSATNPLMPYSMNAYAP